MQEWLNQNAGKVQLNPDPPHGINGQCVNAASSWSMAQGGPELFPGATAWDIWLHFNHPFFEKVTSGFQPGDILFYSPNNPGVGTGNAGHVDICLEGSQTADSDWDNNPDLQILSLNLVTKAAGAFRPVKGEQDMPTKVDLQTAQKLGFWAGGRDPGEPSNLADLNANHVGRDLGADINNWWESEEWQNYNASIKANAEAAKQLPGANDKISQLTEQVTKLQAQLKQALAIPAPQTPTTQSSDTITITKDGLWAKIKSWLGL